MKIIKHIWLVTTAFAIGLTPYLVIMANRSRTSFTIGGEIFVPIIPTLILAIGLMVADIVKMKDDENE